MFISIPTPFSEKYISSWGVPTTYWCLWFFLHMCKTLLFTLFHLLPSTSWRSSQPISTVPWPGSTTLWFLSYSSHLGFTSKLAGSTLCPTVQVKMKMLKRLRPSFDPWDTPLLTSLQLDLCHVSPSSGPGHSPEVIVCMPRPYINCFSLKSITRGQKPCWSLQKQWLLSPWLFNRLVKSMMLPFASEWTQKRKAYT